MNFLIIHNFMQSHKIVVKMSENFEMTENYDPNATKLWHQSHKIVEINWKGCVSISDFMTLHNFQIFYNFMMFLPKNCAIKFIKAQIYNLTWINFMFEPRNLANTYSMQVSSPDRHRWAHCGERLKPPWTKKMQPPHEALWEPTKGWKKGTLTFVWQILADKLTCVWWCDFT